ncbi:MAG: hypothetical protein GY801_24325 [bacterium]|nr:hypothetical protein [bacterium]
MFEFKKVDKDDDKTPQDAMKSALKQIREKEYATELRDAGVCQRVFCRLRTWISRI